MPKEFSFSLGIGSSPLVEVEDQDTNAELHRIVQAINILAFRLDEATGSLALTSADRPYAIASATSKELNMCRLYAKTTVSLTAGELVHYTSTGELVKAQANGAHNLKAQAVVLANTTAGSYAPLAARGIVKLYSGLTPGNYYYLSPTAGAIGSASPAAGNTLQYIGFAVSPSELYFCPEPRHSVT